MKPFFSKNIFTHTIKKLGLISLLSALLASLITILLITDSGYQIAGIGPIMFDFRFTLYSSDGYTALGNAPILIFIMFFVSAFLAYHAFSYQNKRSEADKEYSLPYSGTQQFTSRIAAVLVLTYGIIIVTTIASWAALAATGSIYTPSYLYMAALGYMSGSTLIIAVVAMAMSFTGTAFANVTAASVILLLPRSILFVTGILITKVSYNMVPISQLNVFLNPSTNIPSAILLDIAKLWQYKGIAQTLIDVEGIVFSFILAIIYLAAALFISNKRKSELAGKSFINRWQSYMFAGLCTAPLIAYSAYLIISNYLYILRLKYAITRQSIILLLFAIVIFTILSVIYNARIKGILRGFAAFAAVVAASFIAVIIGYYVALGYLHSSIKPDKVDYVQINISDEIEYRGYPTYTYGMLKSKDVKLYDEALINLLTKSIDLGIENIDSIPMTKYPVYGDYTYWCEFHMKSGREIVRLVPVNIMEDARKIADIMLANQEFHDALYSLPSKSEVSSAVIGYPAEVGDYTALELYDTLYNEIKSDGDTKRNVLPYTMRGLWGNYPDYKYSYTSLVVSGKIDGEKYKNRFSISYDYVDTLFQYLQINSESEKLKIFKDTLNELLEDSDNAIDYNLQITFFGQESLMNYNIYSNTFQDAANITDADLAKVFDYFLTAEPDMLYISDKGAAITLQYSHIKDSQLKSIELYVPLSDEIYEHMLAIARNQLD